MQIRTVALAIAVSALPLALDAQSGSTPTRLCAGGDVSLGTNLDTSWTARVWKKRHVHVKALPSPDALLAPLSRLIADADVVLYNNESAIGDGTAPSKCRKGSTACYALRTPSHAADALARFGAATRLVANVANNHSRDAGDDGLEITSAHLRSVGIDVTGDDTLATVVELPNGDTLAFLGFSVSSSPSINQVDSVRRIVAQEAAKYPVLIVTAHVGAEGVKRQHTGDSTEHYVGEVRGNPVALAHASLDAGAAMFIGHGPHVLRAMEWYRGRLVMYSLGNLLTYGDFGMNEPTNRGAIACVVVDHRGQVLAGELRSTVQLSAGVVRPDRSRRAVALVSKLSREDFPASAAQLTPNGTLVVKAAATQSRP